MITSEELQVKLWEGANTLRGSMDASRYKDYMLGLMFYKFLSEKTIEGYKRAARISGTMDEVAASYAKDFEEKKPQITNVLKRSPGYYIEPQYLYSSWVREIHAGTFALSHVTDGISRFEQMITGAGNADDFKDLFSTMNLNDPALGADLNMQSRNISALIKLFAELSILELQENDVIGDAYEYLIGQFAMESGKKAGEFYTPHQVSDVIARIVACGNPGIGSIYDPAAGSGSLLLTVRQYLGEEKRRSLHYYGQELNTATYNLARMNLLLHGIRPELMDIRNGDTLADDWPEDSERKDEGRLFDSVVMNPPYSLKNWNKKKLTASDPRFEFAGVLPPDNKGDFAFLLHGLYHLGTDGIMAIVLPHGVLFRGAAEGIIRKKLVDRNRIDAVIGLPANLFTNTGIPVIIMVLKKNRELDAPVQIMDASKGFVKDSKTNRLRERDIAKIVDAFLAKEEIPGFSHLATRQEIMENDYNLNIPRYVDSMETEIPHDVDAHLYGGIPAENLKDLTALQTMVPDVMEHSFRELRPGYLELAGGAEKLRRDVLVSRRILEERQSIGEEVDGYLARQWEIFKAIGPQNQRNLVELHDAMLQEIKDILSRHPFLDIYSGYQVIADIWSSSLAHDLKIIRTEGFYEAAKLTDFVPVRKGKREEERLQGKVIPNEIVKIVLFSEQMEEIQELEAKAQELETRKEEWIEKANAEESPEADILSDSLKEDGTDFDVKLLSANARNAPKESEAREMLLAVKKVCDDIKACSKEIKEKEEELRKAVEEKYPDLTNPEIEQLYRRKWFHGIQEAIVELVEHPFLQELNVIEALAERYAQTLEQMDGEIARAERELALMQEEFVVME